MGILVPTQLPATEDGEAAGDAGDKEKERETVAAGEAKETTAMMAEPGPAATSEELRQQISALQGEVRRLREVERLRSDLVEGGGGGEGGGGS